MLSDPFLSILYELLQLRVKTYWVMQEFQDSCICCELCVIPMPYDSSINQIDFTNYARDKTSTFLLHFKNQIMLK